MPCLSKPPALAIFRFIFSVIFDPSSAWILGEFLNVRIVFGSSINICPILAWFKIKFCPALSRKLFPFSYHVYLDMIRKSETRVRYPSFVNVFKHTMELKFGVKLCSPIFMKFSASDSQPSLHSCWYLFIVVNVSISYFYIYCSQYLAKNVPSSHPDGGSADNALSGRNLDSGMSRPLEDMYQLNIAFASETSSHYILPY